MKGFHFYLEYPSKTEKNKATRKSPGNHSGNVLALYTGAEYRWVDKHELMCSAINAVMDYPNSGVCTGTVSLGYIRERCKRISETQARTIHPNLFSILDNS